MKQPLITIGLCCYNASETISRAIKSALNQDWPNLEIIIVDDLSTDNSRKVAREVIAGQTNARLITHEKNQGPAGTRNTIIKEAAGDYIAFFDDDDESLSNRITCQFEYLKKFEEQLKTKQIACYASGVRHYANGYQKQLPAIGSNGDEVPNGKKLANYLLFHQKQNDWFYGAGTPTCSLMARTETFKNNGSFDPNLRRVEDVDFAIRLAMNEGYFIGTRETLFNQYATEAFDKSPEKNLEAEQALVRKNKNYLSSIGKYYYALHWPKLRYWHFKKDYFKFTIEFLGLVCRYPFSVLTHILATGPRRLIHERKMKKVTSK